MKYDAEYFRIYKAAYRHKKRANGLCYSDGCSSTPTSPGSKCEFHQKLDVKSTRDRKLGKGATEHLEERIVCQNGLCDICGTSITRRPQQDHNHQTGKLRGALCVQCNIALERAEISGWLQRAENYLRFWD